MTTTQTPAEDRQQLEELLKDFRTAMCVTRNIAGEMHSRPVTIAEVTDDCTIYIPTSSASGKAAEIEADPHVNLSLQSATKFVSITGRATMSHDRALIERLWSDTWKLWFPEGKDDPDLVILTVQPHTGEYWDESGTRGIRYLFQAAAALARGEKGDRAEHDQHARVTLG
jgi:general stress protein 26